MISAWLSVRFRRRGVGERIACAEDNALQVQVGVEDVVVDEVWIDRILAAVLPVCLDFPIALFLDLVDREDQPAMRSSGHHRRDAWPWLRAHWHRG